MTLPRGVVCALLCVGRQLRPRRARLVQPRTSCLRTACWWGGGGARGACRTRPTPGHLWPPPCDAPPDRRRPPPVTHDRRCARAGPSTGAAWSGARSSPSSSPPWPRTAAPPTLTRCAKQTHQIACSSQRHSNKKLELACAASMAARAIPPPVGAAQRCTAARGAGRLVGTFSKRARRGVRQREH